LATALEKLVEHIAKDSPTYAAAFLRKARESDLLCLAHAASALFSARQQSTAIA